MLPIERGYSLGVTWLCQVIDVVGFISDIIFSILLICAKRWLQLVQLNVKQYDEEQEDVEKQE